MDNSRVSCFLWTTVYIVNVIVYMKSERNNETNIHLYSPQPFKLSNYIFCRFYQCLIASVLHKSAQSWHLVGSEHVSRSAGRTVGFSRTFERIRVVTLVFSTAALSASCEWGAAPFHAHTPTSGNIAFCAAFCTSSKHFLFCCILLPNVYCL